MIDFETAVGKLPGISQARLDIRRIFIPPMRAAGTVYPICPMMLVNKK
jgi:hypothetical protein